MYEGNSVHQNLEVYDTVVLSMEHKKTALDTRQMHLGFQIFMIN